MKKTPYNSRFAKAGVSCPPKADEVLNSKFHFVAAARCDSMSASSPICKTLEGIVK